MSVAERTREAVRREPFLLDALAAGVVNYSAAARYLEVEGDEESVATALRRFADELDPEPVDDRTVSVRLHRGVSLAADPDSTPLLAVGSAAIADGGDHTAVQASGPVGVRSLERVLGRLRAAEIPVVAAGASVPPDAGEESNDANEEARGGEDSRDGEGRGGEARDGAGTVLVVVGGRDGARALRVVEATVEAA